MLESMEISEPAALRAIANPVRQRILMQMSVVGHARAADLAEAIGQPANSVSFHLRVLAKAGLIVEAPEHARDKRDRVWTNVAETYQIKSNSPAAGTAILRPALRWVSDVFTHDERDDGAARRQFLLTTLLLTKEEADGMAQELAALIDRWSEENLAKARDSQGVARDTYQVVTVLGPRDDTSADDDEKAASDTKG
ncbi:MULTISPECIES: ArsR/SmtB family transcription factor [unclassified Isoptericola]|uniref:ArsR/SmtB family transcription factor n=1 Tax=unclassified Isoptericola TaxID=2623355 RepID=UPI0036660A99